MLPVKPARGEPALPFRTLDASKLLSVGVPADWPHHYAGLAAHWNKNANLGHDFDVWFLNLFPRQHPFVANDGGYLTLSFIPTLGTMILGLIAGGWLRTSAPVIPTRRLIAAGAAGRVMVP